MQLRSCQTAGSIFPKDRLASGRQDHPFNRKRFVNNLRENFPPRRDAPNTSPLELFEPILAATTAVTPERTSRNFPTVCRRLTPDRFPESQSVPNCHTFPVFTQTMLDAGSVTALMTVKRTGNPERYRAFR